MAETPFDDWIARHYDVLWPEQLDPVVVEPIVDVLAGLVGSGPALELGIGTGRIALPLARRGVTVHGIELSSAMAAQLHAQPGASGIGVTIGDFATAVLDQRFNLVYVVANTITNLTTQHEQVECFRTAARHLEPGGSFLIECYVPELRRIPPGETTHVFTATPTHVGVSECDVATQLEVCRHWWAIGGELRTLTSRHRYVWPTELDLMAQLAGLVPRQRWSGWKREPFTGESRRHVSVWQKPA